MSEEDREVKPWDFLKKDTKYAVSEIRKERLSICQSCPEYFKFTKQCKICLCIMPSKVILADASCPIGKWDKTDQYTLNQDDE